MHPDLVRVVERAIELTAQDFFVIEGVRSPQRQKELWEQGRVKPGPVVTWTLHSRHFAGPDGYGRAVDIAPYPLDWDNPGKFDAIAKAMLAAANGVGVQVRWGANWDGDGYPREAGEHDSPHWELA